MQSEYYGCGLGVGFHPVAEKSSRPSDNQPGRACRPSQDTDWDPLRLQQGGCLRPAGCRMLVVVLITERRKARRLTAAVSEASARRLFKAKNWASIVFKRVKVSCGGFEDCWEAFGRYFDPSISRHIL